MFSMVGVCPGQNDISLPAILASRFDLWWSDDAEECGGISTVIQLLTLC